MNNLAVTRIGRVPTVFIHKSAMKGVNYGISRKHECWQFEDIEVS